ncbi:MAG TPA: phage tail sheath subtilisin-like domain-containing protein [Chloroflexia bacterium]|nr:phage tail sheath subtilisin-like domain-containing protein [Chloroflexia bacterium]
MPEYLAPGVYIEETSFRSKAIEGVSTTTTGFIGFCRYGPLNLPTDVITGLNEFERVYGDRQRLEFGPDEMDNFLWHGVRAFFEEGGKRLYISRVFKPLAGDYPPLVENEINFQTYRTAPRPTGDYQDGHARGSLPRVNTDAAEAGTVQLRARFPGAAGNMLVRFTVNLSTSVLGATIDRDENGQVIIVNNQPQLKPTVNGLRDYDIVWITDTTSPVNSPPGSGRLFVATSSYDSVKKETVWTFEDPNQSPVVSLNLDSLTPSLNPNEGDRVRIVTLTVTTFASDGTSNTWSGLAPDRRHTVDGAPDSLKDLFAEEPTNLAQARTIPLIINLGENINDGLDVLNALIQTKAAQNPLNDPAKDMANAINNPDSTDVARSVDILLEGGNDGLRPEASEYEGTAPLDSPFKTGLKLFEDVEDISIVAAPGYSFNYEGNYGLQAHTIANLLIAHATQMRYRIAVLDSGNKQTIQQVRAMKGMLDSKYAALYYPWVTILDPVSRRELNLPPSGFVAGIYARNDINRAVYKAPANEVVNLAIGFEKILNKSQQDILNPENINCFRFFEGRGFLLWGARTISSDPEWKYVNLRRYFAYLERSIDKGTQWAVFEPNGPLLWDNVRRTIEDFLLNEWQSGALLGDKPEKAYFVRCDRSVMTQNDIDNGRLICLVGVSPLRPAEFVIFRIGQWTGDRKV